MGRVNDARGSVLGAVRVLQGWGSVLGAARVLQAGDRGSGCSGTHLLVSEAIAGARLIMGMATSVGDSARSSSVRSMALLAKRVAWLCGRSVGPVGRRGRFSRSSMESAMSAILLLFSRVVSKL